MPNQLPPFLEEQVVAFAQVYPGMGARRVAASLGQKRVGRSAHQPQTACSGSCAAMACRPGGTGWR